MITQEMLSTQEVLGGLTDEQVNAIVTLSKNDEEQVIGNRFREVYNKLDETIARETGISRNGDEKTYLYLERAAKALKGKADSADTLQVKVNELSATKAKLEKAIQDGTADEQTKKQLAQALKDLESVKGQYNTLKTEHDTLVTKHQAELMDIRIENELSQAVGGIKFKAELPKQAVDTLLLQTIQRVKGMNPEYIEDGQGGKRLVFKDAQGAIVRNAEKQLEPITAGDLLTRELKAMGILDEGRKAAGAGTKPLEGGGGAASVDVSGAKTQVEANEIITQQLMQRGIVNGSKQFQEEMSKAWQEYNIKALPLK